MNKKPTLHFLSSTIFRSMHLLKASRSIIFLLCLSIGMRGEIVFATGESSSSSSEPARCTSSTCAPQCQFSGPPEGPNPPIGSVTTTPDEAESFPSGSSTVCVDMPVGIAIWRLRSAFNTLLENARSACESQQYCNWVGTMSSCTLDHENVDPPHPFPPAIVTRDGANYFHGCFTFNCRASPPPKGCEDDDPTTCDNCNDDYSCSNPPCPEPTPPPTPEPSPSPES